MNQSEKQKSHAQTINDNHSTAEQGRTELKPVGTPFGRQLRTYSKADLDRFVKMAFVAEAKLDGYRSEAELSKHFEESLFFITVTFRSAARSNVELCRTEFKKFYFYFCRLMVGSYFQRKQALQPLTFFCIDDEGSRHVNVNLSTTVNAHVHALALARPEVSRNWNPEMKDKLLNKVHGTDDIDIQKFDPQKSSLENLISYTTKGLRRFQNDGIFYDFLPGGFEARQQSRSVWHQRWKTSSPVRISGKTDTGRFKDFI